MGFDWTSALGLGGGVLEAILQRQATKEYERAVEGRYAEGKEGLWDRYIRSMQMYRDAVAQAMPPYMRGMSQQLNEYRNLMGTVPAGYNQLQGEVLGQLGNEGLEGYGASMQGVLSGLASEQEGITQGYQNRYREAMNTLEGSGTQERKDIEEQYANALQTNLQDMTSRGLSGTTVLPTLNLATEREKSGAMGRLNERLLQQKLATMASLTGEELGYRERAGQLRSGLTADTAARSLSASQALQQARAAYNSSIGGARMASRETMGTNLANLYGQQGNNIYNARLQNQLGLLGNYLSTTGDYWNWIGARNDVPPSDNSALMSSLGSMIAQPPEYDTNWLAPTINAGGNIGSSALMWAALA
jgi:hypothetical protein